MKQQLLLLFTCFTSLAFCQHIITGTISDNDGVLPFANISVKNTSNGVMADENGFFSIEGKSSDVLEVSYLGYKSKTISVENQKTIDVILDEYEELQEVVIIGFTGSCRIEHTICFTCSGGCSTLGIPVKPTRVVNNVLINDAKLYPNPSRDGFYNLRINKAVYGVEILVSDMQGRKILNFVTHSLNSNFKIDLSNQPSGMYIINMFADGTEIALKKAIRL